MDRQINRHENQLIRDAARPSVTVLKARLCEAAVAFGATHDTSVTAKDEQRLRTDLALAAIEYAKEVLRGLDDPSADPKAGR